MASNSLGMLLGSVRSAMMKQAMRASSVMVSLMSRVAAGSKSNKIRYVVTLTQFLM
jgi:hypothetical protein